MMVQPKEETKYCIDCKYNQVPIGNEPCRGCIALTLAAKKQSDRKLYWKLKGEKK